MFKHKAILTLIVLLSFLTVPFLAQGATAAQIPIDLTVNNQYIHMDAKPFLMNNTTYVPIRFVSEALGAEEVIWDALQERAIIKADGKEIILPIGENDAQVDGQTISLREGIKLVSGRTFVPVRFVAENLNASVTWDQTYYTVNISKGNIQVAARLIDTNHYSTDEIFWLARIIEAECSGEPMEGKIAVGNVILNRVQSTEYPNAIYGVIFDDEFGVQFEPISNGSIYNSPSADSFIAAKRALNGENYAGDSLYFLNASIAASSWIQNNRPYYSTIRNHSFYL